MDFNWNEFGAGLLGGIADALSDGDDNTQSPAPAAKPAAFDVSSALPLVLIGVGAIVLLKVLKVF